MKKSDVNFDLRMIIERLDALKNSRVMHDKQSQIDGALVILNQIAKELSLGMSPSITGRANSENNRCRFCGK